MVRTKQPTEKRRDDDDDDGVRVPRPRGDARHDGGGLLLWPPQRVEMKRPRLEDQQQLAVVPSVPRILLFSLLLSTL